MSRVAMPEAKVYWVDDGMVQAGCEICRWEGRLIFGGRPVAQRAAERHNRSARHRRMAAKANRELLKMEAS